MHTKKIITAGKDLDRTGKALIMLHGRGANAEDILSLSAYLDVDDFTLLAPQATNNTWYPFSFLAPPPQNEPSLSSAISVVNEIVSDLNGRGISSGNIYFLGFSQGACLALEYVTRHAMKYGGVAAFTGGLIGDKIYEQHYTGQFEGTPVLIATSDPDPHVPVERVHASTRILQSRGANVMEKIYPNMGHTINQDEIALADSFVFKPTKARVT